MDGSVNLKNKDFKELPHKFGKVNGYFDMEECKNLISLKNCPNFVGNIFSCSWCSQLDSFEECPKEVSGSFYCFKCKQKFTEEEVRSLCKVKIGIFL